MNKKIGIIAVIVIFLISALGIFRYFTKEDINTTLTIPEKKWIENNKNNLIDLSILNNASILSSNGEGVVFDFLTDLEKTTNLDFNKKSNLTEETTSDYAITVTNKKSDKDILIYQDNYALLTKNQIKYYEPSEIKNLTVGVLEDDMTKISKYLDGSDLTYKSYKTADEMIKAMDTEDIDAITLPKIEYLGDIIKNDKLYIAYNITEYTRDYILKLGDTKTLNKILTKYFEKWSSQNLEESIGKNLIATYFKEKDITEKEQVTFRSKRYNYGFVENSPFDVVTKDGVRGFNYSFLNNFETAANIEIDYKKYSSIENVVNDFETNKLDIIFGNNDKHNYNMDTFNTSKVYDGKIVIVTKENVNTTINTINSLTGKTIHTIKNSEIDNYLKENGVNTKPNNNIKSLINRLGENDLIAIDYYTYDSLIRNELKEYKVLGTLKLDKGYSFTVRDIKANKTFGELLDFYLSFENNKKVINNSYKEILNYNNNSRLLQTLLVILSAVLLVLVGIVTGKFFKQRKNHNKKLSKTDKLRYIDSLTSLKNRNYLNDNVEAWDNSDVYPQAVIVVDLNNIAYINDNFGHAEGDKVIVEGAGILISNQMPNSEILRSNGNEFLIYMVGHDEKAVITFIRKLNKEFKTISHNFGAAIGYSMITDEIKTIDDAINEATSDMRNNKEETK